MLASHRIEEAQVLQELQELVERIDAVSAEELILLESIRSIDDGDGTVFDKPNDFLN